MIEAISLGEALIDFISYKNDVRLAYSPGFKKALGGAPANVAVGLAKQNIKTAFIGKVGDDPFGTYIKNMLQHYNVNISSVIMDKYARTTLAFVSRFSHGQNDFVFYRHPGADMMLSQTEIKENLFKKARIFHFGSISLINQPSRDATLKAIKYARKYGLLISYDPNLRLSLWDSPEAAKKGIWLGLKYADIVKISDQEWEFITGTKNLAKGSLKLLKQGIKLIIVSLGAKGCYYNNGKTSGYVKGYKVKAIDTTGAGDGFMAAVLAEIFRQSPKKTNLILSNLNLRNILQFANAAGALATTNVGAAISLPTPQAIKHFLNAKIR
ncbi:MAG: PfkB family carbohydrate kinase [Planctomycetota bacterium]